MLDVDDEFAARKRQIVVSKNKGFSISKCLDAFGHG